MGNSAEFVFFSYIKEWVHTVILEYFNVKECAVSNFAF